MSSTRSHARPVAVVLAVVTTVALAAFTASVAVLSWASGHGVFSMGVAIMLVIWALLGVLVAVLLWRRFPLARGPVVAMGAVHALAYGQFGLTQGWAWIGSALAAISVVSAVWPSTTAWLTPASRTQ